MKPARRKERFDMMMPIIRGLAWTIGLAVARALLDYALEHRAEKRSEKRLEAKRGRERLGSD